MATGIEREASAVWAGNLRTGTGNLFTRSKALHEAPYSFVSRFEQGAGTNPEELIAAAHSGCFSMALSKELETSGITPKKIATTARVSLAPVDGQPTIHLIHLEVEVTSSGGDQAAIQAAAERAKANCPVSRLLNAKITLNTSIRAEQAA